MPFALKRIRNWRAPELRFWQRVNKTTGCWNWTGAITTDGYGSFWVTIVPGVYQSMLAHRFSFMFHGGKLIEGLTIDHLCRNRKCVNPRHLEQVSSRENILRGLGRAAINSRKTKCLNGHPFDGVFKKKRFCRICRSQYLETYGRRYYQQNKEKPNAKRKTE